MEFEFTRIIDTVKMPALLHADMIINGVKVIRAGIEKTPDNKSKYYVVLDKNDPATANELIDHLVVEGHFDARI